MLRRQSGPTLERDGIAFAQLSRSAPEGDSRPLPGRGAEPRVTNTTLFKQTLILLLPDCDGRIPIWARRHAVAQGFVLQCIGANLVLTFPVWE